MTYEPIRLGTRAAVTPSGLDTGRLLKLAEERAPDPSIFETVAPFFWDVRASSNRLDFYDTRMRPGRTKTLGNFVRGLKDGVSYQDSHDSRKNGWGQSLDGRLVTLDEEEPEIGQKITEAWGTFFTLPDQTFAGQDTNSFINAVRSGVWRDVSVGFFATDIECGLCGKQSFDWWAEDGCQHLPGFTYEWEGAERRAWAWVNDGELSEVSQVYDGASPAAAVVKAEQMSLDGSLDERERARVERRHQCRIALPERRFVLGGVPVIGDQEKGAEMSPRARTQRQVEEQTPADTGEETQIDPVQDDEERSTVEEETVIEEDGEERAPEGDAQLDGMAAVEAELLSGDDGQLDVLNEERSRFAPHGIRLGTSPVKAVRALGDEVVRLRARLAEERTFADLGRSYRKTMIDEAIEAGVRALGNDFKVDQYRSILDQLDVDGIRLMRDDFLARGAVFEGGRHTKEDADHDGGPEVPAPQGRGRTRRSTDPEAHKG